MSGTAMLTAIIEILVGAISGIASGIGNGLSELATNIFLAGEAGSMTLSTFGSLVIVFAGIALAMGLCRWVLNFITSLGARNR